MKQFALAMLAICLLIGCGGDDIPRVEVRGEVTLDGEPLKTGAITFIPTGKGPSAGTTIQDGAYVVDAAKGPSPGEYKVEIDSSQPTGKKVVGTDGETMEDEYENVIPAKYNRQTTLKVVLEPDGDNEHNFPLKSK